MKMNVNTMRKVRNLHMMTANKVVITHDIYNRLFGEQDVPSWATLKAHGLLTEVRRESRLPEGEVFTTTPEWERVTVYYTLNV